MTSTVSPAFQTWLDDVTRVRKHIAVAMRVVNFCDPTQIVRVTTHPRKAEGLDIGAGDGAQDFLSPPGFERTNIESGGTGEVDNFDIHTVYDAMTFTEADLRSGRWRGSPTRVAIYFPDDIAAGVLKAKNTTLGKLVARDLDLDQKNDGLFARYGNAIVRTYEEMCDQNLGSTICGVRLEPPLWTSATAVTVRPPRDAKLGSVVRPTTFNDFDFKCTVAGTTDSTEPTWVTGVGNLTVEPIGGVTWEAIDANVVPLVTVTGVTDKRIFATDYAGPAPDAFFDNGAAVFLDGANVGPNCGGEILTEIGGAITLKTPMPLDIQIGDTLKLIVGCNHDDVACRDKHDNILNQQAFWMKPEESDVFRIVRQ